MLLSSLPLLTGMMAKCCIGYRTQHSGWKYTGWENQCLTDRNNVNLPNNSFNQSNNLSLVCRVLLDIDPPTGSHFHIVLKSPHWTQTWLGLIFIIQSIGILVHPNIIIFGRNAEFGHSMTFFKLWSPTQILHMTNTACNSLICLTIVIANNQ